MAADPPVIAGPAPWMPRVRKEGEVDPPPVVEPVEEPRKEPPKEEPKKKEAPFISIPDRLARLEAIMGIAYPATPASKATDTKGAKDS